MIATKLCETLIEYLQIKRTHGKLRKAWEGIGGFVAAKRNSVGDAEFFQWCEKHFPGLSQEHIDALLNLHVRRQDLPQFVRTTESIHLPDPIVFWRDFEKWSWWRHLPQDLRSLEVAHTVRLDERTAKRLAHLFARVKKALPGDDIPRMALKAFAVKHDTTVGELEKAVAPKDPHRAPDLRRISVETRIAIVDIVDDTVRRMASEGQNHYAIKRRLDSAIDYLEGVTQASAGSLTP
ncbi:hypothetical protein LJR034_002433 [Caballeronia sp. LjRoot34]|uniref:hypothetical protein n=1 Tax=Caballeronia sp. LjRoot34 TaxID=3342325 RepID=UPI003ECD5060